MELRHLRYFCAVAEAEGFARAAAHLHVSQSAISEQMRDLEAEIGVPLFDRSERRATLTAHGKVFWKEALLTLSAADWAIEAAQRSVRGELGALTIGFFVGGTDAFFPRLIRTFRQQSPKVRVSLTEMTPTEQYEALLTGAIDIGFTRALQSPLRAELRSERFFAEPLLAVLPSGHRLAGAPVLLKQLATERFVMTQRESSPVLFDKIIALCRQAGFSPAIATTSTVASGVLTLVAAGAGVAILPLNTLKLAPSDVVSCPIRCRSASIDLVFAWSPEREGPLHRSFLRLARQAKHDLLDQARDASADGGKASAKATQD